MPQLPLPLHDHPIRSAHLLHVLLVWRDQAVPGVVRDAAAVDVVANHLADALNHPLGFAAVLIEKLPVRDWQGPRLHEPSVQNLRAREAHHEDVGVGQLERRRDRAQDFRPARAGAAQEEPERADVDVDGDGVLRVLPSEQRDAGARHRAGDHAAPLPRLLLAHGAHQALVEGDVRSPERAEEGRPPQHRHGRRALALGR
mmetsp:Transcript_4427/g.11165  ORF Transcript_4427/g.11165 Transcript_4427/m.11165 type:complete len:200 (-) Transcript_4427:256-855(-)